MKNVQFKRRVNKLLSVLVIYALFLNEFIPFSYAINTIDLSQKLGLSSKFSTDAIIQGDSQFGEISRLINEVESNNTIRAIRNIQKSPIVTITSSGPGQAETSGFSLNSTDEMVDKFTGDFSYKIPLMDVEGYPIVLSYNSNVTMLQEASWVGLGWDLNVGAVSREMRGIPDDFNGSENVTVIHSEIGNEVEGDKNGGYLYLGGSSAGGGYGGGVQLTLLLGNYTDEVLGKGKTVDLGLGAMFSINNGTNGGLFGGIGGNLGYNYDSKKGIGSSQSIGLSGGYGKDMGLQASGSITYGQNSNTRYGKLQQSISLGASGGYGFKSAPVKGADPSKASIDYSATSTMTYGTATMIPRVQFSSTNGISNNFQFDTYFKLKSGVDLKVGYIHQNYSSNSFLDINDASNTLLQPAYGYMHSGKRYANNDENEYPIMDYNRGQESEFSEEMKNLSFSIQTHDIFYVNASGLGGTFRPQRKDYGTYYDPNTVASFNQDSKILTDDNQSSVSVGFIVSTTPTGIGVGAGYGSATLKGAIESGNGRNGVDNLRFETPASSTSNNFDETIYFRSIGEQTPVDMSSWDEMNGSLPDYYDVNNIGDIATLQNNLKESGDIVTSGDMNNLTQETYAATYFNPIIATDANGSDFEYKSWPLAGVLPNLPDELGRSSGGRENHISKIEVVSPNGTRYNYGVPVYNYTSSEVAFSVEDNAKIPEEGMVVYSGGVDNSIGNTLGRTHYFDKTTVPAYTHSYLLTEMTSSDYIDRTYDGPTLDDMGTWYKFNHTRVYGADVPELYSNPLYDVSSLNVFKWRFPMSGGSSSNFPQAKWSRGVLGSTLDDMGHYSYGVKEIWYTQSVESKNFIAVFYLENRNDMYSVEGEDGILDEDKPLKCIDKIVLYNRSEWEKHINSAGGSYVPLPLQTVDFDYDYSLCQKSPGNPNTYSGSGSSGKLTLKEIRVFGGNSSEKGLASYKFDYGDVTSPCSLSVDNPCFNYTEIDAWGGYKPYDANTPNDLYTYSAQDEAAANSYVQAWKLKAINTPLGGKIEITYEADRYETVQTERAMRHFNIFGMVDIFRFLRIIDGSTWNPLTAISDRFNFHHEYGDIDDFVSELGMSSMSSTDRENLKKKLTKESSTNYIEKFGKLDFEAIPQNVIIFELDEPISAASRGAATSHVREKYFKPNNSGDKLSELFFKVHVDIKENADEGDIDELVPLMADISVDYPQAFGDLFDSYFDDNFTGIGAMPASSGGLYEYGYVIIDPANTGENEDGEGKDDVEKGKLVINPLQLMSLQFARQYLLDVVYGSCDGCDPNLSIDWKVLFGGDMYEYMIKDGEYAQTLVNNGSQTSKMSTIRLFEPDRVKFGGNARVKTIKYIDNWSSISGESTNGAEYIWNYSYLDKNNSGVLVESGVASFEGRNALDENSLYTWDSYINIKKKFPDERKFTPTPVAEQLFPIPVVGYRNVEVTFSGPKDYGKLVSKFHTSKEWKYRTKANQTTLDKDTYIKKRDIFTGNTVDLYGFSQGFVVETNDYHGKPISSTLYDVNGKISESTYHYYEMGEKIPMIDRDGTVENENIALEYDIHADARFVSDIFDYNDFSFNLEFLYYPPAGFSLIPGFGFSKSSRERGFYSHSLVKHINYSAVLKGITTEYLGSINHAENHLYDKYTGQPLLTSLNDEYNDKLFNMNYPSHWNYREFRELNNTTAVEFPIVLDVNGKFFPSLSTPVAPGDKIKLIGGASYYVAQEYPVPDDGSLFLIDWLGEKYTTSGTYTAQMLVTSRNNRLVENMQNVVSKISPYDFTTHELETPTEVLSSSAITYRDRLSVACGEPCEKESGKNNNELTFGELYNPYVFGIRGDLIVDGQYAWQDERKNVLDDYGIRYDGTYVDSFIPFYQINTGVWHPIDNTNHPENDAMDPLQKWRKLSEVTVFDKYGKLLESRDQIDIYSSVLYGYSNEFTLLPVAQAVNARQSDIAFDGFEDYDYMTVDRDGCPSTQSHFDFKEELDLVAGIIVTGEQKHSGLASLKIPASNSVEVQKKASYPTICSAIDVLDDGPDDIVLDDTCACILPFEPSEGKYIIGAWVRQSENDTSAYINVTGTGLTSSATIYPTGKVIDGWQRLEGTFEVNSNGSVIVSLVNDNNTDVYFDDFRIHPFLSGMTTVVYDPKTLLPLATHDGYNFTTFYNYDENLNQVRVRVETIEGIKTIVEQESGGQKN